MVHTPFEPNPEMEHRHDGNGTVSFKDYIILEANFGKSIPEPSILSLLAAGVFLRGSERGPHSISRQSGSAGASGSVSRPIAHALGGNIC